MLTTRAVIFCDLVLLYERSKSHTYINLLLLMMAISTIKLYFRDIFKNVARSSKNTSSCSTLDKRHPNLASLNFEQLDNNNS